jgi:4'-phosphopantetheinyl transferase
MSFAWLSQGEADLPPHEDWLTPREAAWVARMRFPKRRSEFVLGRWTAKRALGLWLGLPDDPEALATIEIGRASDGAPAPSVASRPAAAAISMTDRAGWAVCVVASPEVGVGCDLELVEPRSEAFVSDYLTPGEQRLVRQTGSNEDRDRLANLIWCGKESGLKVLRTGLRRDTRSVEVSFPEDGTGDGWLPMVVQAEEGGRFPGWWRRYGSFLLTVAATSELSPPRALDEPPGLAGAVPTHSWWRAGS